MSFKEDFKSGWEQATFGAGYELGYGLGLVAVALVPILLGLSVLVALAFFLIWVF